MKDSEINLRLKILTPEKILSLSHGEIKISKTIDIATRLPVPGGLHCMKIFGPVEDFTCYCGLIRHNPKAKGAYCPECGVPILERYSRRERLGHITLASPVIHPLFTRHVSLLLNIPPRILDEILFCRILLLESLDGKTLTKPAWIRLSDYMKLIKNQNRVGISSGAQCILKLLQKINVHSLYSSLKKQPPSRRVNARLRLVRDILNSETRPEWFVITHLPVLPADLRPVIFLDDGTVASHDLNELYASVINQNNRFKKFLFRDAPFPLLLVAQADLQRVVNCLLDGTGHDVMKDRSGRRVLKGITAMLSTKEGRLRKNLLGKRVDYSGRSVITAGPELKLHQVGLPRDMAFELFRPHMYHWLIKHGYASSIAHARAIVDARLAEAHEALENVIEEYPVLLNRAPTLHRLSVQAFYPVLHNDRAIRLHPLVCSGYNADFDGDQMAVHVPLSYEAQIEVRMLMLSAGNLLHPATGEPAMIPSQDIVLGLYWLTLIQPGAPGEGKIFSDPDEVFLALENQIVTEQSSIKVRLNGVLVDTTPGRLKLLRILPQEIDFSKIKFPLDKKAIKLLVQDVIERTEPPVAVRFLDDLKSLGFHYATLSGISLSAFDTPRVNKKDIIMETNRRVSEINEHFQQGFILEEERYNRVIAEWMKVQESLTSMLNEAVIKNPHNSISLMISSGARGSIEQLRQLTGMKGLMTRPTGEIVDIPVKSSLIEGLSSHEFFLSTHGARKGRSDGALKTAQAGYLTRRLVEVAQDVCITNEDCGTLDGIELTDLKAGDQVVIPLKDRIKGRTSAISITDPLTGEIIVAAGELITAEKAQKIHDCGITSVIVRSPVTCKELLCAKCYGTDLTTGKYPEAGLPVGVMAAQSIGEPGTQLTLRTFHSGGAASVKIAGSEIVSPISGTVKCHFKTIKTKESTISVTHGGFLTVSNSHKSLNIPVPYGARLLVKDDAEVRENQPVALYNPDQSSLFALYEGILIIKNLSNENSTVKHDQFTGKTITTVTASYPPAYFEIQDSSGKVLQTTCLPPGSIIVAEDGSYVFPGDDIARILPEAVTAQDITSGIKEVESLFEAREPEHQAVLSPYEGEITNIKVNDRIVDIEFTYQNEKYTLTVKPPLSVSTGDYVFRGQRLSPGEISLKQLLQIEGMHKTAVLLLDKLQLLYFSQGIPINPRHFEVIIRKMLNFMVVTHPGNTDKIYGEIIPREVYEENLSKGLQAVPVILGITRAALYSNSFLSRASFMRTGTVLADEAVKGSVDELKDIKSNVILGRLIPAGTGLYKDLALKGDKAWKEVRNPLFC